MSSERERILELEQMVTALQHENFEAQRAGRFAKAVSLGVRMDWLHEQQAGNPWELLDASIERHLRRHPEHAEALKRPVPPQPLIPFYSEQEGQAQP